MKRNYRNISSGIDNCNVTRFVYSATGEKLRVVYQTAVPNITVAIGSARELMPSEILYTDSTDYLLGGALTLKNGRIDMYQFDEGYCQATQYNATQDNFTFLYYDRDHLGNVRQVTKAMGSTGTVMQTMNYYPFGAQFCDGSADTSDVQPYKYNGKELDKMHGLNTYDYGARQYNPITARWDRVDPLAEMYYPYSPYMYCLGNPNRYIDPDGKAVETIWDAANVALDASSIVNNVANGNLLSAVVDVGALIVDIAATAVPFVPGGAGTAVKAYRSAKSFKANVKAGKEFERGVIEAAKKEGRNVSSQIIVVPKNGVGNVKGNRSRVDMLEKKKDGTYIAHEIKLSHKSKPSKGQRITEKHVKTGNQSFVVRSKRKELKRGDEIKITDYRYIYKYK